MPDHCANPLYRDWVKEWMDHAQTLKSKAYYTYKKAYESLDKCTEVFDHPCQTIKLAGIGPGLATKLEDSLKKHCKDNGIPMPELPGKGKRKKTSDGSEIEDTTTPVKSRASRPYIPRYRTGGYGILICLLEIHAIGRENLTREQICRSAQEHCNSSYTLNEPGKSYTAWSSMKTLLEKGYIYKSGSPAKYRLTETGIDLAKTMQTLAQSNVSSEAESSTTTHLDDDMNPTLRNPSTARSRKKNKGTSTSDILSRMIDFDDDTPNELDLSLYVSNPSNYQSISINGRSSNMNSSSTIREDDSEDLLQALADSSRSSKNLRTKMSKKQQKMANRSTTAAYLDNLLEEFEEKGSGLEMSDYVLNPSEHQSISLGNHTAHTKPATSLARSSYPASQNTLSSNLTSQNTSSSSKASFVKAGYNSSFARKVMESEDSNDYSNWNRHPTSRPSALFSSKKYATATPKNTKKYTTPNTSVLLKNDKKTTTSKSSYNIDEYEIDLTELNLPTFESSQLEITSDDIVNLLSSPESSPPLRATQDNHNQTFEDELDLEADCTTASQPHENHANEEKFHYTYLSSKEEDVRTIVKAAVMIDEENACLAYRIRFYTSQYDHPTCKKLLNVTIDATHIGCSIGYISELDRDTVCPGLPARPVLSLHREEPDDFWPQEVEINSNNKILDSSQINSSQMSNSQITNSQMFNSQMSNSQMTNSQMTSSQITNSQTTSYSQTPSSSQIHNNTSQQFPYIEQNKVNYDQIIENEQMESMLPHEYEIVLVLDSREIQMKTNRDYFQRKFASYGVKFVTRAIELGDFIWIARRIGSTNQSEELFLDYIAERKRLDDLVSSIRDGRYTEQKSRLMRCGADKVFYIVEEYDRSNIDIIALKSIQTAMTRIQMINRFFLKTTESIDDTISFLLTITNMLNQLYKDTTLYSIPGHIITRQNYLDLKRACKEKSNSNTLQKSAYLITYPMFSELNSKSGGATIHETFIHMLSTIRGVSAERALALIRVYPTPFALLKAFEGRTAKEGKNIAKEATQNNISRRRWGASISERLYNIWGAMDYPNITEGTD